MVDTQMKASAVKYRQGEIPQVQQVAERIIRMRKAKNAFVPRASRSFSKPRPRDQRDTSDDEQIVIPEEDEQEERPVRNHKRGRAMSAVRQRRGRNPWTVFGAGMLVMLLLWSGILHISVWYINTFYDPGYYTQTAHHHEVWFKDVKGQPYHALVYVDEQNRLNLLIIPNGDPKKARIVVGPHIGIAPKHAMITATVWGTLVTVSVQGPLQARWFDLIAHRQVEQWSIDASQQPGGEQQKEEQGQEKKSSRQQEGGTTA